MIDMSNSLFHASFAFVISIIFLRVCDLPPEMALVSAIISMLMDLDTSLSPSSRYERAFHSPWALLIVIVIPFMGSMLSYDPCFASLPAIAVLAHLFQDVISGEIDLGDDLGGVSITWTFMPRVSKVIDVASLPIALGLMLL
jgi:hypothetical protein